MRVERKNKMIEEEKGKEEEEEEMMMTMIKYSQNAIFRVFLLSLCP